MEVITVRLPIASHHIIETGETTYEYAGIPIEAFLEWCNNCIHELELRGYDPLNTSNRD